MSEAKTKTKGDEPTTGGSEEPATSGNVGLSADTFAESVKAGEADAAAREQFVKDHTLGEVQPVITTEEMKREAKYFGRSKEDALKEDEAGVPPGVSGEPPATKRESKRLTEGKESNGDTA